MEWRPIAGYEGRYEVSNIGDVYSLYTGRDLKLWLNTDGYYLVNLTKNGKGKTHSVHRLIAKAFIPNPENKPQVDHINRIRHDNRIENLRWATRSENCANTGIQKNNTIGLKNITKSKCGYEVRIMRNKLYYYKCCKTEEEAIFQRDLMLSMWN